VGAQPGTRWRKQKVDDGAKRGVARPCKGWGGSKPIRELGGLVKEVGGEQHQSHTAEDDTTPGGGTKTMHGVEAKE
jgi:hypothetical protein